MPIFMGMDTDFELYKGKSFKDLCKDIYSNQENRKEQIETFIDDLRPLIKNVNDAMIVVPLIKGYLDTGNTNDDHLVRLAAIIQKIMTAQSQSDESGNLGLTEEEKKSLMLEIEDIKNSDTVVIKKLSKEDLDKEKT